MKFFIPADKLQSSSEVVSLPRFFLKSSIASVFKSNPNSSLGKRLDSISSASSLCVTSGFKSPYSMVSNFGEVCDPSCSIRHLVISLNAVDSFLQASFYHEKLLYAAG